MTARSLREDITKSLMGDPQRLKQLQGAAEHGIVV